MVKQIFTKSGNSYALSAQQRALEALVRLGQKRGPVKSIPDPVEWQRQQRISSDD
jgi:hypothetical protein